MNAKILLVILLFFGWTQSEVLGQSATISGKVIFKESKLPMEGVSVIISPGNLMNTTSKKGIFIFESIPKGKYQISLQLSGFQSVVDSIEVGKNRIQLTYSMENSLYSIEAVDIEEEETDFGIARLNDVEGTAIYAAKKNEVIVVKNLTANLATNNSRQIYAKVAGLNIWESDGAGVQLGIGGRGLSPSRNSNFNTRQNGYDISADALGYPESYYTPPVEAIDRIEVVRGAASLQYGTQFGGMLNFKFKQGPEDKKLEATFRQAAGSFGFYNAFTSVGGTVGKVNYYGFYQFKTQKGWRPNSSLNQHTAYAHVKYQATSKLSISPEFTFTNYLAQQPGGLTDAQFADDPQQSFRERNWFHVNWNLASLTLDYEFSPSTSLNSRTFGLMAGRDALGNLSPINQIDFGENRDFLSDDFKNWGNETRLIHRYSLFDQPAIALGGIRYYDGMTLRKQGEGYNGSGPTFDYLNPENLEGSDFDLPSKNFAAFAEHIINVTPKLSITPGIRFEYIRTQAIGYYRRQVKDLAGNLLIDETIDEDKTNQRSFVFGGLGISYKPTSYLEIYGNASQNYRAINFNDIRVNVGSLVVDENLQDERGFNMDLGIRGNIGQILNYDLTLFHLSYKDRIGTILKKEPNPNFNNLVDRTFRFRTNVADASIYGFESLIEWNLWKMFAPESSDFDLVVFSNLAIIQATYHDAAEENLNGNEVELVPNVNLKTGINLRWKELRATFQYVYVGEQFSDATNAIRTPTAIEGIIPAYQVADISLSYERNWWKIESGVNNLTDEMYFTRRATGYPGPGIIPSQGRNVYLALQVRI